jgi:hypothetical protein
MDLNFFIFFKDPFLGSKESTPVKGWMKEEFEKTEEMVWYS